MPPRTSSGKSKGTSTQNVLQGLGLRSGMSICRQVFLFYLLRGPFPFFQTTVPHPPEAPFMFWEWNVHSNRTERRPSSFVWGDWNVPCFWGSAECLHSEQCPLLVRTDFQRQFRKLHLGRDTAMILNGTRLQSLAAASFFIYKIRRSRSRKMSRLRFCAF